MIGAGVPEVARRQKRRRCIIGKNRIIVLRVMV
jgi:hypothetical protein